MKPNRPAFMPLNNDVDDNKLELLAATKGVGALVKPDASQAGEGGGAVPSKPESEGAAVDLKALNLQLPAYVKTALQMRAVQRQTSLKHVVMTALVKDGIAIDEADMIEDGRRLRGP